MNIEEKIRIAQALELLGVDIIEAGFPAASKGDLAAVKEISGIIKDSQVCALSRASKSDIEAAAEALKGDQDLEKIEPFVADSGEGRWTAVEAIEQGIPAPVLTQALQVRFRSQEKSKGYGYKILSIMRNAFGGHVMKKKG